MASMSGVHREGGVIVLHLVGEERPILASLAAGLAEVLEPAESTASADAEVDPLAALVGMGSEEPVAVPEDPAIRRLLPDAYADADGAAEFRRLTDSGLRAEKIANLRRVLDGAAAAGGVVRIEPDAVDGWLAGLNDIRLVLGERLEMTEEREHLDDLDGDDPRLPLLAAYDWLSYLQEAILELLLSD
jgi:hypothetical protein